MDKRVIFAVAGAGKTTYIIDKLEESSRALIVTYTNNNLYNLKKKVIKKLGHIPEGVRIISYFSFVYGFCYRPYLSSDLKTTGIIYEPNLNRGARKSEDNYYLSPSKRLFSNRIALLVQEKGLMDSIRARVSKYYDLFIIDEVQDLSAHDFNLMIQLTSSDVGILFVGDFFQYTYATSRDGNTRRTLHDDIGVYKQQFEQAGLIVDEKTLIKSRRCSLTTCRFVNDNLGITIESHSETETELRELDDSEIESIVSNNDIVKLFYDNSSKYNMLSRNWGESKGEDSYNDICIVLNPTTYSKFIAGTLSSLAGMTKNKLYVALTRARGNVYFVQQSKLGAYKHPELS